MPQSTNFARRFLAVAMFCGTLLSQWPVLANDDNVREYVDEITAASITVALQPLVFARERTDLAANARDYITLAPVEINRTGTRRYFWTGYIWSTIDRRGREPMLLPGDQLVLIADGRPITLRTDDRSLRDQGVGEPPVPAPTRTAVAVLYAADPESIAYVSRAAELRIELVRSNANDPFLLWKDARQSVRAFSERVGGG